jgi:hypothetical protein
VRAASASRVIWRLSASTLSNAISGRR